LRLYKNEDFFNFVKEKEKDIKEIKEMYKEWILNVEDYIQIEQFLVPFKITDLNVFSPLIYILNYYY